MQMIAQTDCEIDTFWNKSISGDCDQTSRYGIFLHKKVIGQSQISSWRIKYYGETNHA